VGGVDGSVYEGMDGSAFVAGGMQYHRARSLTGKLSRVISESRSAIAKAKERNESARNKRVEKQKEEREELRKEVKELWDRDRIGL
jgi:rRNA maturation endonuclease Nob1